VLTADPQPAPVGVEAAVRVAGVPQADQVQDQGAAADQVEGVPARGAAADQVEGAAAVRAVANEANVCDIDNTLSTLHLKASMTPEKQARLRPASLFPARKIYHCRLIVGWSQPDFSPDDCNLLGA
jgi:hypothetical protein